MYDADKPMLVGIVLLISTLFGLLATGVLGGSVFSQTLYGQHMSVVAVDGVPVYVEIADTPEERMLGLSGRPRIAENQGLLFVFEERGKYSIWMRNMQCSLDVYWLDARGVIVDMWQNAHPESYPQVYEPRDYAYYILEVNAGFSEVYNIDIGDRVTGLDNIHTTQ